MGILPTLQQRKWTEKRLAQHSHSELGCHLLLFDCSAWNLLKNGRTPISGWGAGAENNSERSHSQEKYAHHGADLLWQRPHDVTRVQLPSSARLERQPGWTHWLLSTPGWILPGPLLHFTPLNIGLSQTLLIVSVKATCQGHGCPEG